MTMDNHDFDYGDILEVIDGPHKGTFGYYDNDDFDSDGTPVMIIYPGTVDSEMAFDALVSGDEIDVLPEHCKMLWKAK